MTRKDMMSVDDCISTSAEGPEFLLAANSEFCFGCFREFFTALDQAALSGKDVIVDLSRVTRLDTAAVGMLLVLGDCVGRQGATIRVRGASDDLIELIHAAGLTSRLPLEGIETMNSRNHVLVEGGLPRQHEP